MSLQLGGLRYSSACHSVLVTQVFKKVPLSSGLLIRGFGVQVPGGAPVMTWGFIAPGHFLCVRFVPVFRPVGAGNSVTLCDLGVFVDQAAEPVPAQNAHTGHFGRRMRASGGRLLLQ